MPRFLVDVCVDRRLAEWLGAQGHDAIHLRDIGLQRLPNGDIFKKALVENRIVVTHDFDFGEIATMTHGEAVTVLVFRPKEPNFGPLSGKAFGCLAGIRDISG